MNPNPCARTQQRIRSRAAETDSYAFFNLLTGPQLLEQVESLLPEHRERLFPPTETLSMFLAQALSAGGSCREVVNDAAVKRLVSGMSPCSTNTAGYCRARARLPQAMAATLTRQVGEVISEGAAGWLALAGTPRAPGRWGNGHVGRHRGESSRIPAAGQSEGEVGVSDEPE